MTTRDIAKKAGVSPSSVSRYFTGAENLSEEIKRKIEAVIGAEAVDQAALRKAPNLIVLAIPHASRAIRNRNIEDAIDCLMVHPLVNSYSLAEELVEAYIKSNKDYIEGWH